MKKMIALLTVALTVSATMSAQQQGERRQMRGDRTEMMVKKYGLNDSQAEQLKALNQKYEAKFGQMRGQQGGPQGQPGQAAPQGAPQGQPGMMPGQHGQQHECDGQCEHKDGKADCCKQGQMKDPSTMTAKEKKKMEKARKKAEKKRQKEMKKAAKQGKQVDGKTGATPQAGQRPQGGQQAGQRPMGDQRHGRGPQMTEEQRKQFEADRKAYNEELQKILTPEQYKNYLKDQQGRRGPRSPRGMGNGQGAPQGMPQGAPQQQ